MKKVLVTGGSGFIGSHTVEALLEKGYEPIVLDNFSTGSRENIAHLSVQCMEADVTQPATIDLIKQIAPDYIIHLAAQVSVAVSVQDFVYDEEVNIKGSLHVMKGAAEAGVEKVIFASSADCLWRPGVSASRHRSPAEAWFTLWLSKTDSRAVFRNGKITL